MDAFQLLETIVPFSRLSANQLRSVACCYRETDCPTGTTIIEQGQPIECVGIIHNGTAKVTVVDLHGNEFICGLLTPGDMIFDVSVLTGVHAAASVVSLEQSVCFFQPKQAFIESIDAYPTLKTFFYHHAVVGFRWGYETFCRRQVDGIFEASQGGFQPPFVRKATDYIDKNFSRPITLEMVADETAMSKFHFSRLFKQHLGLSFKQYLNRKRIQVAKVLLSQNGYNVTEASFAVGFNDASYFSRVFREMEGSSPKRFLLHG